MIGERSLLAAFTVAIVALVVLVLGAGVDAARSLDLHLIVFALAAALAGAAPPRKPPP